MPTYQYACTNADCGNQFELVQSFTDPAASECPVCDGRVRKVFSAVGVVFKGSGFYRTDSRAQDKSSSGKSSSGKSSSDQSSSDQSSSETGAGKTNAEKPSTDKPSAASATSSSSTSAPPTRAAASA